METQPIVSNSGRAGRRPLPPELSGKNGGDRRERWYGEPADYSRSLAHQFAYDLGVKPTATHIQREINFLQDKYLTREELARRYVSPWNKHRNYLTAESLVPEDAKKEMLYLGSRELFVLSEHIFWIVYRRQPTNDIHFVGLIDTLHLLKKHPNEIHSLLLTAPNSPLIQAIDREDSLRSLAAAMLLTGAAVSAGREDTHREAFDRVLRILTRLSCVAPFAAFGDEFHANVIESMLKKGRVAPAEWHISGSNKMKSYRQLIRHGRDTGFLTFGGKFPRGRNNEELAVLRLADKEGHDRLHTAFDAYANNKTRVPNLCVKLRSLFDHPSVNLYAK